MGKLLRNTTLRSVGRAIVSLLLFFCFSQGVWAENISVTEGETIYLDVSGHNYANNASAYFSVTVGGALVYSSTDHFESGLYPMTMAATASGVMHINRHNPDGGGVWNEWDVTASRSGSENILYFTGDTSFSWGTVYLRPFSAGSYIYLKNGKNFVLDSGTSLGNTLWVLADSYAGIKFIMADGSTQYAWFSLCTGETAGTEGAMYRAQIPASGNCVKFVVTRNGNYDPNVDPTTISVGWKNWTGNMTFSSDQVSYSAITGFTGSNTWTGSMEACCTAPTPATGDASSISTTTVTLAARVTSGTCTTTKVGVNVYSDSSCETLVTYAEDDYVDDLTTYSLDITSLSPATTYYYKAYAKSDVGTTEDSGAAGSFTTTCDGSISITDPEGAQTACLGSAAALSVVATGPSNLTYQWYYSSTNESKAGATAVPGATSATYTPAMVGAFYYYCAVGAAGGYCEKESKYSGLVTIKGVPVLSASTSSTTNYAPVKISAAGAENITWSITSGTGGYLYKTSDTQAMFKGNVGSDPDVVYTVTGTTANDCSSAVNITVSSNTHQCR